MIRSLIVLILIQLCCLVVHSQELSKEDFHIKYWKSGYLAPNLLTFEPEKQLSPTRALQWFYQQYALDKKSITLRPLSAETDLQGNTHQKYQQYAHGIKVENGRWTLHLQEGKVYAMNGELYDISSKPSSIPVSPDKEFQKLALAVRKKTSFTHPEVGPELLYHGGQKNRTAFKAKLCWKYDISAKGPYRAWIYQDISSAQIVDTISCIHPIDKCIHLIDEDGIANTRYSGARTITTEAFFTNENEVAYRLRQSGRGKGIYTYNMNGQTNVTDATDFIDDDNDWDLNNSEWDNAALDAHWGAEKTYDYFKETFNRNSLDNEGKALISYIHFDDSSYANAFWNGEAAFYGDDLGRPFSSLDIVAHEFTHGLTGLTAGLIYRNESGALNESFSDIFGKVVEFYAKPASFTWVLGQDREDPIRNMADPNAFNDPRYYRGLDWYEGEADNGGVHINSGVQNFWFYLLSEGGSGINDAGENYSVKAIGMDKAAAIAYQTLTAYLNPQSDYEEARLYSTLATIDLYGACSSEHEAVTNAWHAVGLDQAFSPIPLVAFESDANVLCTAPFEISFKHKSANAASFRWSFGDGTTSTEANPTHSYLREGNYDITLEVDGFCGGSESLTQTQFISIKSPPTAPNVNDIEIQCREQAVLNGLASGEINWFYEDGSFIGSGNNINSPPLNDELRIFARNFEIDAPQRVGPVSPNELTEGSHHNTAYEARIYFDVYQRLRLNSFWVDAGSAANRNIVLEDEFGNLIQTITVFIPEGQSRVKLNLDLAPGSYRIGGQYMDLYRNRDGASYPYLIEDILSINSAPPDAGPGAFYYFFDWEISTYCASDFSPLNIQVNPLEAPSLSYDPICGEGPAIVNATVDEGTIEWIDQFGNPLGRGLNFLTPVLSSNTTFQARYILEDEPLAVGPDDPDAVGPGSFHNSTFDARLQFEVIQPIRLLSVWVNSAEAKNRTLFLENSQGDLIKRINLFIPEGQLRIPLDLDLQPGKYQLGGANMNLYRNNDGATYPYEIDQLVKITGSNAFTSAGYYYYFYDWELSPYPCESDTFSFTVPVLEEPEAAFSYEQQTDTILFTNLSQNDSKRIWDFGDGTVDSTINPVHVYDSAGTYIVRLTILNQFCQSTVSDTIIINSPSIETSNSKDLLTLLWNIYPNPAKDRVIIQNNGIKGESTLRIINLLGETLSLKKMKGSSWNTSLNTQGWANGSYWITIQNGQQYSSKKLIIQ